jgi:hypothetical protein
MSRTRACGGSQRPAPLSRVGAGGSLRVTVRSPLHAFCLCLVPLLAHCGDGQARDDGKSSAADLACQAREIAVCEAEPGCRIESGVKLRLEKRCVEEPTPVACLGPIVTCDLSFTIGESTLGELFRFAEWCWPADLTMAEVTRIDHPLHSQLFDEEPNVWNWPTCPASVPCLTHADCAEGEYCNGEGPCNSPGVCQEITRLPCPLPLDPDGTRSEAAEVCGCDGVTYQSACVARSGSARIASEGGCP